MMGTRRNEKQFFPVVIGQTRTGRSFNKKREKKRPLCNSDFICLESVACQEIRQCSRNLSVPVVSRDAGIDGVRSVAGRLILLSQILGKRGRASRDGTYNEGLEKRDG